MNRYRYILAGILAVSVILRVGAAFYLGDEVVDMPGTADQLSYHSLALRVIGGYGFSFDKPWWPMTAPGAPTAHWSFLYTAYLALVYSIFGPHPLLGRLIQAVLVGILHPYLVFLIGRRVFEERVGLIAAALTAVYTYFIYYAGALMTEPFYILGILASLYLAIKIVDTLTEKHDQRFNKRLVLLCFGFGFFLGATALLRQLFLLVIPFIFLWVWWASGKRLSRDTLLGLATTGLIILLMVVPFTAYNYARFNRFVLLNTNSGFAFFWGNHPIYGTHFEPILPAEMGTYQDLIPNELRHLDEAALDNALLQRGIKFITDDPRRYVLLSLSRIPPYFMFWPSKDSGLISNLSRVGGFGLFLPFMIYGLVRAFIPKPPSSKMTLSSPGFLLILFGLVYAAIHILTWTLIRYRLPIDAVMLIFAALAFFDIAQRLGLLKEPQIGGQQI